jgi:hypothetical protein
MEGAKKDDTAEDASAEERMMAAEEGVEEKTVGATGGNEYVNAKSDDVAADEEALEIGAHRCGN